MPTIYSVHSHPSFIFRAVTNLARLLAKVKPEDVDKAVEALKSCQGDFSAVGGIAEKVLGVLLRPTDEPVGPGGVIKRKETTTTEAELVDGKVVTTRTHSTETVRDPKIEAQRLRESTKTARAFVAGLGEGEIRLGDTTITPDNIKTFLKLFRIFQEPVIDIGDERTGSSSATGDAPVDLTGLFAPVFAEFCAPIDQRDPKALLEFLARLRTENVGRLGDADKTLLDDLTELFSAIGKGDPKAISEFLARFSARRPRDADKTPPPPAPEPAA